MAIKKYVKPQDSTEASIGLTKKITSILTDFVSGMTDFFSGITDFVSGMTDFFSGITDFSLMTVQISRGLSKSVL